MSATRIVGLALLAVVGLAIAPVAGSALTTPVAHQSAAGANGPSGGLQPQTQAQTNTATNANTDAANTTTNTTVATFLQATSADAQSSVDSGLFDATYHATDTERRAALVTDRADEFEQRLAELEAEREELREREDSLSSAAYEARLTRLTVTIASLNRSIERTKSRGVAAGLDEERFETLQQTASDLAGPDIAATAQKVVGVDRHPGGGIGVTNGPPADRGPPNSSTSAGAAESPGRQPPAAVPGSSPESDGRGDSQDRSQGHGRNQSQTHGQNPTPTPTSTPTPAQNADPDNRTGQGSQSNRGSAHEQNSRNSGENSDRSGNGSPARTGPPTDAAEPSTPETDADSSDGSVTDGTSSSNADTDADSGTDTTTTETPTDD
ncbi:hypothetical protein [Natrialba asiatica]|uniref:Uncharacterized protein n=1 Tax=Natrialba asiatica (strain ATCC 700177 / DSM 12278 / JCM 9576 / FERM P-10747 / NBRC 102637 / 172P1) TaxID=29540 RepID=M0AN08_NATA1|nr:hypothetical protein [Natrialba asiatica]ELY99312.1 hypothetical protein C481_15715 [Natrialba asiatica DSM 12278]